MSLDSEPLTPQFIHDSVIYAIDLNGRPVNESNVAYEARLMALELGVSFILERNKNPDTRKRLLTNRLALVDILKREDELYKDLAWLHHKTKEAYPGENLASIASQASWLGASAVLYGINRVEDTFPVNAVPLEAAHLYKVCLGLWGRASDISTNQQTGEEYYQNAIINRELIRSQTCPASKNLIIRSANALLGKTNEPSQRMDALFSDPAALIRFSKAYYDWSNVHAPEKFALGETTLKMNQALGRF